ncbi:hypothetical protein [Pseudorhodobacter sp. E13]|uniref:hypothetical protein n=1 Tax=Pseudorhodobacter sp. E13 TaxID=2487931 RepID=UPI000F8E53A4|nr:hypothetical protein [Pseudorhodobacter sp. E13]
MTVRVIIDPHMFGESWFVQIRRDLVRSNKVRFAYGGLPKEQIELRKQRAALEFFVLMGKMKRRDDAHQATIERFHDELISSKAWVSNSGCCDDSHTFSLVRALPARYVFSKDNRMARCRDCLSGCVDATFLRFSVIGNELSYARVRAKLVD